jgi:hypothetical protein
MTLFYNLGEFEGIGMGTDMAQKAQNLYFGHKPQAKDAK